MLTEQQNIESTQRYKERKPLNLRVSYTPDLEEQLLDALDFVLCKLDFELVQKLNPDQISIGIPEILIDVHGNSLSLLIQLLENKPEITNIIFHTNDCLRDYHKYIVAGVEFVSRPQYTKAGLQVGFMGSGNKCYTLLEEREYLEQ